MKKKKLYQQELGKIENIKMTLETQVMNLESSSQNAVSVQAMREGTQALQDIHAEYGIEEVGDLMDEVREEMDNAQEINDALRVSIDPMLTDDEDLLKELEALDKPSNSTTELVTTTSTTMTESTAERIQLPEATISNLPIARMQQEEDMKKVEGELVGI